MTKKDYERAAGIVQDVSRYDDAGEPDGALAYEVIEAFVTFFRDDGNPRFDEARFRAACVPGANVKARPKAATS
jgi:hypothetical protein